MGLKEAALSGKLPAHIGVIMDGNGRWAEARGLPRAEGHRRGAERAKEIIASARELGIGVLTLYMFSLENWRRPRSEVSVLMKLLELYLKREMQSFKKNEIRFKAIGELWRLPDDARALVEQTEELTASCSAMTLVAAISYSGRNEIIRAVKKALDAGLRPEELDEAVLSDYMDTAGLPEPDLIIRTSGERRISNFLTWQTAYSEFYFTDIHWPDFERRHLIEAVRDYQSRERRFGTVKTTT